MGIVHRQKGEPMSDYIDRQAAISIPLTPKGLRKYQTCNLDDAYNEGWGDYQACVSQLPSAQSDKDMIHLQKEQAYMQGWEDGRKALRAQPYAEAEIQKMQDLEQAELEKVFELGKAEALSEIVRCKDCKYYEIAWLKKDGTDDNRYKPSICVKGQYGITRKPDWFCADAERRTDATD